ncbi:hypothetical protein L873DRAFT_1715034 [Choiromyces venosus 120613-1]|uniref:Uncharacterized protein n=1 Tax=Choiromyces venosus 120613-1 TaxID=1336337 RepID=A0A3N4IYF9_9PEZI|nr:hypothetical protein L873DRAFT_1715034 [Choiromyces venosus 120613-1]
MRPPTTSFLPCAPAALSLSSLFFSSGRTLRVHHSSIPQTYLFRQHHPDLRYLTFFRTSSRRQLSTSVPRPRVPPSGPHSSSFANDLRTQLLLNKQPPSESQILFALTACQNFVNSHLKPTSKRLSGTNPTSAILSLDEGYHHDSLGSPQSPVRSSAFPVAPTSGPQDISEQNKVVFTPLTNLAFELISHPAAFISPKVLSAYVSLQSMIRDPTPIPVVFSLYANKSYTSPGTATTIIPNANQSKNAIPWDVADAALCAAIEVKDMALCLDIIDTSYGLPAFRRAKLIREATPIAILAGLMPPVAYVIGDMLAKYQDDVDHSLALGFAFTGILAYITFTAGLGIVAVTTTNDQMVRVTWAVGTPLRFRWLREEERAAYDRVAQAWGFEETVKRGFEEGEAWELLREVVFRKNMILDNPDLMDGME